MDKNIKRTVTGDELVNFLKKDNVNVEVLKNQTAPLSVFTNAARYFFNNDNKEHKLYLSIVFKNYQGIQREKSRPISALSVTEFLKFFESEGVPPEGVVFNSVEGGISSRACAWAGIGDTRANRKRLLACFNRNKEGIIRAIHEVQSTKLNDIPVCPIDPPGNMITDCYPVVPAFDNDEIVTILENGETLTGADLKTVIDDGSRTPKELWLTSPVMDVCGEDRVNKSILSALFVPSAHSTSMLNDGVEGDCWVTEHTLSDKRLVVLPYNQGGYHWCVIFADFCAKTFSFIDSFGARNRVVQQMLAKFLKLLETRNKHTDDVVAAVSKHDWTIKYLNHAKQIDNYNCGVLVLNYIENLVTGKALTEVADPHDYRKVIVDDILRIRRSVESTGMSTDIVRNDAFLDVCLTENIPAIELNDDSPSIVKSSTVSYLDDSSGSEINVDSNRRGARRLSFSSESSVEHTSFYKKQFLESTESDDSAGDDSNKIEEPFNRTPADLLPNNAVSATSGVVLPCAESSQIDSADVPLISTGDSSETLTGAHSRRHEAPHISSASESSRNLSPSKTTSDDIDSDYDDPDFDDADFDDNSDQPDPNEAGIFPKKMKRQMRETRKVARSSSALRYASFSTLLGKFELPSDTSQSLLQGENIDRPNLGFLIKERISETVSPCPVNLSDSGRFNKSRTIVSGYAYCEHRGCRHFKFTISNISSRPLVTVFSRGELDHSGGPRTTQLRGVKRQRAKEILKTTKASKYMEGCIKKADEMLIAAGNLQDIRPLPTIDKVRSEILAEGDLHPDDVFDIVLELRRQEGLIRSSSQYIRRVADPLQVYIFSQEQLNFVLAGVSDLFFDSTGSVVRKPRQNLKRVMYYSGVVDFDGEILPILEFISSDHDAAAITSFLIHFKYFVSSNNKPWPLFRKVVTDFSLAIINAIMLAWNSCTLEHYLKLTYKVVYEKKDLVEFKQMTILRLCRNHFMKNSAADVNKSINYYPAAKVAKEGIALLVAARSLKTFERLFKALMTVFLSKTKSPEMVKQYEFLERMADGFADDLRSQNTETSEDETIPLASTREEEYVPGLFKGSPFWVHFCEQYEAVVATCAAYDDDAQYPLNSLHQPVFVKDILVDKLAPTSPLWSDAMASQGILDASASNAPAEKWFDIVKNSVVQEETNLKVGRFTRRINEKNSASMKTLRFGLTEYLRPKGRVRRSVQSTGTADVENKGVLEEDQWAKRRRVATHFQGDYLRSRVFRKPAVGLSNAGTIENHESESDTLSDGPLEESVIDELLDVRDANFDFGQHSRNELMYIYGESSRPVLWGDFYSLFNENKLSSVVIDAVLYVLPEMSQGPLMVIPCDLTLLAFEHSFDAGFKLNELNLVDKTHVAMPYCIGEHWVLGVFNFVKKEFSVVDPDNNKPIRRNHRVLTLFKSFLARRNRFAKEQIDENGWTVVNVDHVVQTDDFNCGPFVMHYIVCLSKNIPLTSECDPLQLRSTMIQICSDSYEAYKANVSTMQENSKPSLLMNGLMDDLSYYTQPGVQRDCVIGKFGNGKITFQRETLLNLCGNDRIASHTIDVVIRALCYPQISKNSDKYVIFSCEESYKCLFGTFGPEFSVCSVDLRGKTGLMPYCIDDHYRLLGFDVSAKTIVNLNPSGGGGLVEASRRKTQFLAFLKKYNEMSKTYRVNISGWTTLKPYDYPRDRETSSSGLYVLMYMMCGVEGVSMCDPQLKDFDPDVFRKWLGTEVLRLSEQMKHRCLFCGKGEHARDKITKSVVRSKMVACDQCNRWIHTKCARNITCSEEELDNSSTHYYCEFCSSFFDETRP